MRLSLDLLITEPPLLHFVVVLVICPLEGDRISLCIPLWPGIDYRSLSHNSCLICSFSKAVKESGDVEYVEGWGSLHEAWFSLNEMWWHFCLQPHSWGVLRPSFCYTSRSKLAWEIKYCPKQTIRIEIKTHKDQRWYNGSQCSSYTLRQRDGGLLQILFD